MKPPKKIKLGRHHFAYLRAIADGLDRTESAKRYLGIDHGHEAITASRNTIHAARVIAKRNNSSSSYRLIGLTIRPKKSSGPATISLEDYIYQNDLQDWSESDVLEMYKESVGTGGTGAVNKHRENLRLKQIELLSKLELSAIEVPINSDMVSLWLDDEISTKLIGAGIVTIGQLRENINRGGVWYRNLAGVGSGKAENIKSFLESICGIEDLLPRFNLSVGHNTYTDAPESSRTALNATTDTQALESWIKASAGSKQTAITYNREVVRFMLWLNGKSFNSLKVEDCLDYMTFLQHIPDSWISRRHCKPFDPGWAPFRGQLSFDSQKQSIVIVAALFNFLHQASFIQYNPWVLVNQKTGDDSKRIVKQSRAISEFGFSEIIRYIESVPVTIQSERIIFIFKFLEAVGLRSMEFLNARLEHFQEEDEGLVLFVNGKGSKNRYVFIPDQANDALKRYLSYRKCSINDHPSLPLISSIIDSNEAVGYQAFYQTVKSWTLRAIRSSALSEKEKMRLELCSPHWLRHTFGTRAVARDVAMDAIQAQMGHASIKTTMDIYGKAPLKRRATEIGKAFK